MKTGWPRGPQAFVVCPNSTVNCDERCKMGSISASAAVGAKIALVHFTFHPRVQGGFSMTPPKIHKYEEVADRTATRQRC